MRREALHALAGLALAIHFAAWVASLQFTSVAIATLLVCTTPIFTAGYEALARGRSPRPLLLSGFAAGTLGLLLVIAPFGPENPAPIAGMAARGAELALAGAVAMAVYLTIVRSAGVGLPTLAIVARTYTYAALILVAMALVAGETPPPLANHSAWFGILAMALVSQLLGHTALNGALRDFTPTVVGFSTLLEPAIAAILASFIFGENLTPLTIAGGLTILGAIALAIRDSTTYDTALEL